MNAKHIAWRCIFPYLPLWFGVFASVTLQEKILNGDSMDESIKDIFEESFVEESRFFNYDRENAFNTSVAFTIPLFSFTLPGAAQTAETGMDSNQFGVLAFTTLFLVGGLGVAIYTTSQGGNEDGAVVTRRQGKAKRHVTYFDNKLLNTVYESILDLPDVLNMENCALLSVCSAHAEPQKFGLWSIPLLYLFPARLVESEQAILTAYEKAAIFGVQQPIDECYYEYPCLIQPLDAFIYFKEYFL